MDAKVFIYMFLVFVTLKLQQTSANCVITLSDAADLTVYNCCENRDAGPGLEGEHASEYLGGYVRPHRSTDEFGTKDWPADVPCKSAPAELGSGTYYLGPIGKPMTVYCNMVTRETCIRTVKATPEINHDPSKGAFWLHEENVQLSDLYTDISVEQLTWLRERAESVRQTIKYNCLDSVPYSKYNMSSPVKLWAWNDVMIGPYPTDEFPLSYSIPKATDKCVEGSTEWQNTIIELQSSNVYRLPIVDLWIGDIRNEKQKVTIESIELCFR